MDMEATYLAWIDVSGLGGEPGAYHGYQERVGKLWLDGGSMFGAEGVNYERLNFACSRAYAQIRRRHAGRPALSGGSA